MKKEEENTRPDFFLKTWPPHANQGCKTQQNRHWEDLAGVLRVCSSPPPSRAPRAFIRKERDKGERQTTFILVKETNRWGEVGL
jgi:hypothetical protein